MANAALSALLPWSQADNLSSLPAHAQRALLEIGDIRRWRSGRMLLRAGQQPESVFVVTAGRVRIRTLATSGEEQILGWLEPGMFGGLVPVLAGAPIAYDFIADGPCEARHIAPRRLFALLERDAATTLAIARMQSLRLSRFLNGYITQVSSPLADRVWAAIRRLTHWQKTTGVDRKGEIAITQADLARAVGASRFRVGLELKRLERSGVISLGRGKIVVLTRQRPARAPRDPIGV